MDVAKSYIDLWVGLTEQQEQQLRSEGSVDPDWSGRFGLRVRPEEVCHQFNLCIHVVVTLIAY